MLLTDEIIKSSLPKEKSYKLTDGDGLFIQIHPNGSKYWQYNYRYGHRQRTASYGVYPKTSLNEARVKHQELKYQLSQGYDPNEEKKKKINRTRLFKDVAAEWYKIWRVDKNAHYAKNVQTRLNDKVFPSIGNVGISYLKTSDFIQIINQLVEKGDYDIAKRTLQMCKQIMRFAYIQEYIFANPITELFPSDIIPKRKKRNYARIGERELPKLISDINDYYGNEHTVLAIKLLMHTFVRTSDLIKATWDEIYWDKKQWIIPAERMKKNRPHIVPLSKQVLRLLKQLNKLSGDGDKLFPHERYGHHRHMSNNTVLYALYRMGYKGRMTGHGFRGIASTILHEQGFDSDHIELQLAHDEDDETKAAYNHALYLTQRTAMMQYWSNYLEQCGDIIN